MRIPELKDRSYLGSRARERNGRAQCPKWRAQIVIIRDGLVTHGAADDARKFRAAAQPGKGETDEIDV
jgi:hypothetical protein